MQYALLENTGSWKKRSEDNWRRHQDTQGTCGFLAAWKSQWNPKWTLNSILMNWWEIYNNKLGVGRLISRKNRKGRSETKKHSEARKRCEIAVNCMWRFEACEISCMIFTQGQLFGARGSIKTGQKSGARKLTRTGERARSWKILSTDFCPVYFLSRRLTSPSKARIDFLFATSTLHNFKRNKQTNEIAYNKIFPVTS